MNRQSTRAKTYAVPVCLARIDVTWLEAFAMEQVVNARNSVHQDDERFVDKDTRP